MAFSRRTLRFQREFGRWIIRERWQGAPKRMSSGDVRCAGSSRTKAPRPSAASASGCGATDAIPAACSLQLCQLPCVPGAKGTPPSLSLRTYPAKQPNLCTSCTHRLWIFGWKMCVSDLNTRWSAGVIYKLNHVMLSNCSKIPFHSHHLSNCPFHLTLLYVWRPGTERRRCSNHGMSAPAWNFPY